MEANRFSSGLLLVLTIILGSLVIGQGYGTEAHDPYKCTALRDHGEWLHAWSWTTPGCITEEYQTPELAKCEDGGKMLFVGDVYIRQIFWATTRKIEGESNWVFKKQEEIDTVVHDDLEYYNATEGIHLKFVWDPWLNSSTLHEELRLLHKYQTPKYEGTISITANEPAQNISGAKTIAMLVGGGHWHARNFKTSSLAVGQYKTSIDNITDSMDPDIFGAHGKTLAPVPGEGFGNQIFFAPVLEPRYERLTPSREATILPDKIDQMNHYLEQVSAQRGINVLWSYANMTKDHPEAYTEGGLHVLANVSSAMADVFTNLRCNAKSAQTEGHLFNRTCCSAYRSTSWIHHVMSCCAFVLLALLVLKSIIRARLPSTSMSADTVPLAILTLLLVAAYCYVADRTHIFGKAPGHVGSSSFGCFVGLFGHFLSRDTKRNLERRRRGEDVPKVAEEHSFLSRSQSDEAKGWIQVFALIYGYDNASDNLFLYEVMRVFVAFYFFLSGYGHTVYFLQTQDYSFMRVGQVMLRLNLLAILLSWVMYRRYASYYFAPLFSFWFLVVYATLKTCNRKNGSLRFLMSKLLVSALATTYLIHVPGVLEALSEVLRIAGFADGSVAEWRSRLAVDKYIVYVGMIIAVLHLQLALELNPGKLGRISDTLRLLKKFAHNREWFILASLLPWGLFWCVSWSHTNKADFDWWMPYLSFLPVISMVLLRNATNLLRTYHCAWFARLGKASLELYLLSQHIWLAGDGRGHLRIAHQGLTAKLMGGSLRDGVVLSVLLVYVACKASGATRTLIGAFR